ncbi:GNAT family N-acetyltransferase [Candidatus Saccharibacteria bacterium]|nr:GNAT family N-acetyltransferase [Candidatus Saccharibacteria bacterium]
MEYREFRKDDYDDLKRLVAGLQEFFVQMDDEYREFSNVDEGKYLDEIIGDAESKNGKIYVAVDNGNLVGFVQGVIIEKDDLQHVPQRDGWIGLLYVEDRYRNKNVGNELMTRMREFFRSENCDSVKLFCSSANVGALEFYKKVGFEVSNVELKLKESL